MASIPAIDRFGHALGHDLGPNLTTEIPYLEALLSQDQPTRRAVGFLGGDMHLLIGLFSRLTLINNKERDD